MPPSIITIEITSEAPMVSPNPMVEDAMPTTGVASKPNDVVTAGKLRLTIAMAQ